MRDLHINIQNDEAELIWKVHDGGQMPVGPKTRVIVRYRCGALSDPIESGTHRWSSWPPEMGDTAFDIVGWLYAERT